ncbi:hypothetical protein BGAL_0834g00010 [Botrytis galanthina]|uniref:Uncharacterized protein n=1 Tax=Botrytis galanthina TaxID=278940 RepID=A0A4S8QLG5_9HELO|nr:hypothetical protein BGAL_0834g00010 [Botrytis galanthina]
MHLLKYNSEGQLDLVTNPDGSDTPEYAILSHTWGADTDELTFEDLMNGTGQGKSGYRKLQFCGEQAKRDGLRYFWVDTCCIDKKSSAELQTAINSMFRWYKNAVKCYVYLSDVSINNHEQSNVFSWLPSFRESRWFTRGWTLQELIAPSSVQFFCSNGILLGDRKSLQQEIHEVTGIDVSALQGKNLSEFSIEQRLSWAENRQTKHEEDRAYSLLGIFDVYMPHLYGEGSENSFRRLQEEIEKRAKKHTLDDSSVLSAADSSSRKRSKPSHDELPNHLSRLQTVGGSELTCQYPTYDIDSTTRQSIIDQLYFPKIDERLTSLTAAQGTTCRWFLTKSEYLSWNDVSKRQDHGGFLWIKGNPGTGKSTLMKLLFEEAKLKAKGDSSKITFSFFFLARGTIEERTITGLYRSLLHQLFEKMIELRDSLEWMTTSGARGIERNGWSEAALKQTLKHAIEKLGSKSLMIFVDALDECEQEQASEMVAFFEELCELAEVSQVSLQICFSSRHYPTIVIQKGTELTLEYEPGHMEDIQHYIKSKSRLGKTKQAEALRSEIFQKSSNIFLWVVLVLDILNSEYKSGSNSIKKISERLNEIPPGLNDLFEMILKRDGQNLEELHLCLKLILFANRPLKPQELYFATQIGIDEDCTGFWDQEDDNIDQMKLFVRNSSKGLAEVTKNKASDVQFIHESVRDFLLGRYETQLSGVPGNFVGHGHDTLRNCCLAQLNSVINRKVIKHFKFSSSNFWDCRNMKYPFLNTIHPQSGISPAQRSKEEQSKFQEEIKLRFPFLDYSVSNILYHANLAQQNNMEQADFLAKFPTHLWVFVNNYFENHEIRRYTDSVTIPYLLAERNLANLIRTHPRKESCFDVTEQRYGPSIFAALATGSDEAAQTLLKIEAEIYPSNSLLHDLCKTYHPKNNKSDKLGRSFTYTRKRDLVSQLLQYDQEIPVVFALSSDESWFDPNLTHRGKTLLIEAVGRDHCIVATYLLDKFIDANCMKEIDTASLLQKAVVGGHVNIIKLLLEKGAEIDCRNSSNETPLMVAIHKGYLDIVKLLLEKGARTDYGENDGATPLTMAIRYRHEDIAKLLLEHGAKIHYRNSSNETPLMIAIHKGHLDMVKLLLEKGARIDYGENNGATPLIFAIHCRNKNITQLLLEKGAEIDYQDSRNRTPLMMATFHGNLEIVKLLLEKGAEIDYGGIENNTPLMLAVECKHVKIAKLLLEEGAEVNIKTGSDNTPLLQASWAGSLDMVKLLLENGAKADYRGYNNRTPLMNAAFYGHENVVDLLLENDAEVNCVDFNNESPLMKAAAGGNMSIMSLLLERGAKFDSKEKGFASALLSNSQYGRKEMVDFLLQNGVDTSLRNKMPGYQGWTPLMHAASNGHETMVIALLENGAEINAKCDSGSTSLYRAVSAGCLTIAELLLERGGKIDLLEEISCGLLLNAIPNDDEAAVASLLKQSTCTQVDNKENIMLIISAIGNAILSGRLAILEILLEKRPNINWKDESGQTPLFWAISHRNQYMVRLLIEKGADIELKDNYGCTPLMHALLHEQPSMPIVKTFLDRGADIDAEDNGGWKPLHIIESNATLVALLGTERPVIEID